MKLWRKIVILIMLLIFAAGLGIMLYPSLQGAITDHRIIQEAHEFLEMLETIPTKPEAEATEPTEPTEPIETEPVLYPELLNAMQSYNQQIWEENGIVVTNNKDIIALAAPYVHIVGFSYAFNSLSMIYINMESATEMVHLEMFLHIKETELVDNNKRP